ncbi:hypothetical protein HDU93_008940 [Gonapodya sp. JEL0774]|nr:hypothetical protein HDU93_008940 [Gonapodya sp. JEL0774]
MKALDSFLQFLENIGPALSRPGTVTVVIGNEAGDPDSMVSALALAYLQHLTRADSSRSFIPAFNFPRADLPIRPECVQAFRHAFPEGGALPSQKLLEHTRFQDELDLDALATSNDLQLIITDHNKLASVQSKFAPAVRGVVDHHVDENAFPTSQCALRVIAPVGSCSSLVAKLYVDSGLDLPSVVPPQMADLLLAPILHDTDCLSVDSGRVTDLDIEMASVMFSLAKGPGTTQITVLGTNSPKQTYFQTYARELKDSKKELRDLSSADLLRRDFKLYSMPLPSPSKSANVGFSTVSWDVDKWAKRDGSDNVIAAVVDFAATKALDVEIVMLHKSGSADKFERQMIVAVRATAEAAAFFLSDIVSSAEMELKPYSLKKGGSEWDVRSSGGVSFSVRVFRQGNAAMSRKLVGRSMRKFDIADLMFEHDNLVTGCAAG